MQKSVMNKEEDSSLASCPSVSADTKDALANFGFWTEGVAGVALALVGKSFVV